MNAQLIWTPGTKLEEVEKQTIIVAFDFYRGNKTATANALGISIRTLDTKLAEYKKDEDANQQRREEHARKRAEEREIHKSGRPGSTTGEHSPLDAIETGSTNIWPESGDQPRVEGNRVIPALTKEQRKERDEAKAGVRLEPGQGASKERAVSVRESEEVQEVLPSKFAVSGSRRGR